VTPEGLSGRLGVGEKKSKKKTQKNQPNKGLRVLRSMGTEMVQQVAGGTKENKRIVRRGPGGT